MNGYLPPSLKSMTFVELTALQKSLFQLAVGIQATVIVHPLLAQLPQIEPDPFEDIATGLFQIAEMLCVLGQAVQRAGSFQDRINLDDAVTRLILQQEQLRRGWHQLLTKPYPASN